MNQNSTLCLALLFRLNKYFTIREHNASIAWPEDPLNRMDEWGAKLLHQLYTLDGGRNQRQLTEFTQGSESSAIPRVVNGQSTSHTWQTMKPIYYICIHIFQIEYIRLRDSIVLQADNINRVPVYNRILSVGGSSGTRTAIDWHFIKHNPFGGFAGRAQRL